MSALPTAITHYEKSIFTASLKSGQAVSHDVYARGQGSVIVIIQELPGIGPETLRLVDNIIASGFRVLLPHLFGPLGRTSTLGNTASSGVGVIGMCLTGNFAMSLMADDSVLAAVASQPSMPFGRAAALHMSEGEIDALKTRVDATAPMKAYRFEGDWMCSTEKFKAIDQVINNDANRVELNTLPGKGHAVLTMDFVDQAGHPTRHALDEILSYFHLQLDGPA